MFLIEILDKIIIFFESDLFVNIFILILLFVGVFFIFIFASFVKVMVKSVGSKQLKRAREIYRKQKHDNEEE